MTAEQRESIQAIEMKKQKETDWSTIRYIDAITDFREKKIVINADAAVAISLYMRNSLQCVISDDKDFRNAGIERLKSLANAIVEASKEDVQTNLLEN